MIDKILRLQEIGFTEIEAKIYIYLLENHGLNGTQISKDLNVSKSATYNALDRMYDNGYIKLIPTESESRNYIPEKPSIILEKLEEKFSSIFDILKYELGYIYSEYNNEYIYNIEQMANINIKIKDMVLNTKETLIIMGNIDFEFIKNDINNLADMGVLIDKDINNNELVVLSDNKEILICNIDDNINSGFYTKNKLIINQYRRLRGLELMNKLEGN